MHGLFLRKFRQFAGKVASDLAWSEVAARAGASERAYSAEDVYEDNEFTDLLQVLADHHRVDYQEMLEIFGTWLAPDLIHTALSWGLASPQWRAMDYLSHVQHALHEGMVRLVPGVKPPRLMTIHYAPRKILIIYLSPRHLCSMAKGIILGIGDYFKERLSVTLKERQCLITGNKECWIYVVKQDR